MKGLSISGKLMIRNVLLDLDDTLFDFSYAERIALSKTLEHIGVMPKETILKRYSELNLKHWEMLERGEITREQVKVNRYKALFLEFAIDASPEYATNYYEDSLGKGHYFIVGAEELLKELIKQYRLYLVSNGSLSVQRGRIASSGIGKYFSKIFISQEVGFDKPSAEFFRTCFLEIPNFKKEETIIVGDSLTSDIQGGINVGIKTVWFNPKKKKNISNIIADYEINKLLELIEILKHFN